MGYMGVPIRRMGDVPRLSCFKMWVTSHPRVISLARVFLLHIPKPLLTHLVINDALSYDLLSH